MGTVWNDVADAMAEQGRRSVMEARARDAARPVGAEGLILGLPDYRRPPHQSIYADDWAVWRVRWDGREWKRTKRLSTKNTFEQGLAAIRRYSAELSLPRVD